MVWTNIRIDSYRESSTESRVIVSCSFSRRFIFEVAVNHGFCVVCHGEWQPQQETNSLTLSPCSQRSGE